MQLKLQRISQIIDEKIDYNSLVFILKVDKKIFFDNNNEVASLLKLLINGGALKIIIDFEDLEVIDSTGIGAFINAAKVIRDNNGDLVFINASSEVQMVFEVIKLKKFIKIYNSEVEAINKFRYIK